MKNKKGFTLIELLAIIVILAIIAVITVPIILNIIDNSKMGAAIDSAYGYKDAVKKYYVSKLFEDNNYVIPNDVYTVAQLKNLGVSVSGQEPDDNSWVVVRNNDVAGGCLQFNDYYVHIRHGEFGTVLKGVCDEYVEFNGKYVPAGQGDTYIGIVYLDPTDLSTVCDETNYVSMPEVKSGCMKFYLYNEDTENGYMLLSHNTSNEVPWSNEKNADNQNFIYNGPRELLYSLYEDTKDWDGLSDLTSSDNYSVSPHSYTIDYTKHFTRSGEEGSYSYALVNGTSKARLITAEEIASILGEEWTISGSSLTISTDYAWLLDNLHDCSSYGCLENNGVTYWNWGYYTASPYAGSSGLASDSRAWEVFWSGPRMTPTQVWAGGGVRPVIKLPKYVYDLY